MAFPKIKGIGIDIEEINRFRAKPFTKNRQFYEKIFTDNEIKYCLGKPEPYSHFAVRFCAKEALIKAIGGEIKDYRSMEVVIKKGKPFINIEKIIWRKKDFLLSMSHDKSKAVAFVIWS